MGRYEIFNDDYKNVLKSFKNETFDAIICDPPYNIEIADWDKNFNIKEAILCVLPLLKQNGNFILFQGWSNVCDTVQLLNLQEGLVFRNWIVWDRIKGRGAKNNFASTREDILWYSKGENYTFNKMYSNITKKTGGMGEKNGEETRSLTNVWYDIPPIVPWSNEKCDHPSQKPLGVMERCIDIWTNQDDKVLDFTMGTGTTGVACVKNRRNFVGIEIDKKYYDMAEKRLKEINNLDDFMSSFTNNYKGN